MNFALSTFSAPPVSLPDPAILKIKAASHEPIIYQPYLRAEQRSQVQAGATPLDISFNTSPDTREYELFQTLYAHHQSIPLKPDVFWGVISQKFEVKSTSPFAEFVAQAKAASQNGFDCYAYNPMIGNAAIFISAWEQGRVNHTGMDKVFDFLVQAGLNVEAPQGLKSFFFCNYVCGNERFWSNYFTFCEQIFALLDAQVSQKTEVGMIYGGNGGYIRDGSVGMRPFVAERLLGSFLQMAGSSGLKIAAYTPTIAEFEWKFGNRLGGALYRLYSQKNEAIENNDRVGYIAWHKERLLFAKEPSVVMNHDDPPALWMQS